MTETSLFHLMRFLNNAVLPIGILVVVGVIVSGLVHFLVRLLRRLSQTLPPLLCRRWNHLRSARAWRARRVPRSADARRWKRTIAFLLAGEAVAVIGVLALLKRPAPGRCRPSLGHG